MGTRRAVHPASIGWAERVRPQTRQTPRLVLFDRAGGAPVEVASIEGVSSRLGAANSFLLGGFQAPADPELAALPRELNLHPLAVDVGRPHQRPGIDGSVDPDPLAFYRIPPHDGGASIHEGAPVRRTGIR